MIYLPSLLDLTICRVTFDTLFFVVQCSIDALLERTIKHMLFLQSVTKHADKLKQTVESKVEMIIFASLQVLEITFRLSSCHEFNMRTELNF